MRSWPQAALAPDVLANHSVGDPGRVVLCDQVVQDLPDRVGGPAGMTEFLVEDGIDDARAGVQPRAPGSGRFAGSRARRRERLADYSPVDPVVVGQRPYRPVPGFGVAAGWPGTILAVAMR